MNNEKIRELAYLNDCVIRAALKEADPETCDLVELLCAFEKWSATREQLMGDLLVEAIKNQVKERS
jgi:hypothetical protein